MCLMLTGAFWVKDGFSTSPDGGINFFQQFSILASDRLTVVFACDELDTKRVGRAQELRTAAQVSPLHSVLFSLLIIYVLI